VTLLLSSLEMILRKRISQLQQHLIKW